MHRSIAAVLLAVLAFPATAETLTGRVVNIGDGDTLTIQTTAGNEKIRLAGIDAPERDQPGGLESGRFLELLAAGRVITVNYDKRDRYRRIVGKVWTATPDCKAADCPRNLDASLALVASGHAWHFKRYEAEQSAEDRARYAAAENDSRARRVGLWASSNPIPPWEWRQGKRDAQPAADATTEAVIGNRRSGIYHEPRCPDFGKVSERNRVLFGTPAEAEAAGYRRAGNC